MAIILKNGKTPSIIVISFSWGGKTVIGVPPTQSLGHDDTSPVPTGSTPMHPDIQKWFNRDESKILATAGRF